MLGEAMLGMSTTQAEQSMVENFLQQQLRILQRRKAIL